MKVYFDEKINDDIYDAGTPKWRVMDVCPQRDYTLVLTFADGKKGVYDAKHLLEKTVFQPLQNIDFFMHAKLEGCSVAWNDDIDIAPEHLYEKSTPVYVCD